MSSDKLCQGGWVEFWDIGFWVIGFQIFGFKDLGFWNDEGRALCFWVSWFQELAQINCARVAGLMG